MDETKIFAFIFPGFQLFAPQNQKMVALALVQNGTRGGEGRGQDLHGVHVHTLVVV